MEKNVNKAAEGSAPAVARPIRGRGQEKMGGVLGDRNARKLPRRLLHVPDGNGADDV